ncbi:hypothetical protein HYPGJ_31652 [Hyphomicrobium sp. GJ21]|jgi:hypothetical protein|nr:hypothetical protein HYPGJ_31652 [Hyphomicrobium sp. GJ21]
MMIYSVQQIKFDILSYIKEFDTDFRAWYVGISNEPRAAMQRDHGVDFEKDIWLQKRAVSFSACRTVQRYFIETLKTDGIPVSTGTDQMNWVYLYRKRQGTHP